jgi:hypothetical protein
MARQTATARPAPQGKGKKSGFSAPVVSKRTARARGSRALAAKPGPRAASARGGVRHLDTVVRVGTAITFAPTGERLRVTKIAHGRITFEKRP